MRTERPVEQQNQVRTSDFRAALRAARMLPGAGFDGGGELTPGGRGNGQHRAGPVFGVADCDQGAGAADLNAVTAVGAGVA